MKSYLKYSKPMEEELYEKTSSLSFVTKKRWINACPHWAGDKSKRKCLEFCKDNLNFAIEIASYLESLERNYGDITFMYKMRDKPSNDYWWIDASRGKYTPNDIIEMVEIMCDIHKKFGSYKVVKDLMHLVLDYNLSYIGASCGDTYEEAVELHDIFEQKNKVVKDKYEIVDSFIYMQCDQALAILKSNDGIINEDTDWQRIIWY